MNLEIQSWYGRFGNNLTQLCHVVWLAKKKRYNITYIPEHPLIDTRKIPKKHLVHSTHKFTKTRRTRFFQMKEVHDVLGTDKISPSIKEYRQILQDVVWPCISKDITISDPFPKETVVIHIRSGDCFTENKETPHPDYVPLPFSWYKNIFQKYSKNWNRAIIVTENDQINPVIIALKNYLCTEYNIPTDIQSDKIKKDAQTILRARSLILSIGYFSKILALLSKNVENLYISNYMFDYNELNTIPDINVHYDEIKNYISIGDWKCTQIQRDQILNHSDL